ncbi:hypothetical protein M9Y10_018885 [Tritrichomonas musculus]|uniref:Microbial-type PARG catalytic domain-containing protein n=1 Tax=Tritrichomonas musculus TaxID=1915356 RepID=A0ABR2HI15_9EUKA
MNEAKTIKKKMTEDHLIAIFNPIKDKFDVIDDNYNHNKRRLKDDSVKGSNSKQKRHTGAPNSTPPLNHQKPSKIPLERISDKSKPRHPLSSKDEERQKIAEANHEFVRKNKRLISKNIRTYHDRDHETIKKQLKPIKNRFQHIFVNDFSSIQTAIDLHHRQYKHIYLLNFADSLKPGGGYLNGRGAQEESLCRQTLLYPTIRDNQIYEENKRYGRKGSNNMIYSADVLVIRDNSYKLINENERFTVDIISSAAVDNRERIPDAESLMEDRIRKIVMLAALESTRENDGGKNALVLGAFGCGVFNNDPNVIANIFAKILHGENLKQYFNCIVFPIYKDHSNLIQIFKKALL